MNQLKSQSNSLIKLLELLRALHMTMYIKIYSKLIQFLCTSTNTTENKCNLVAIRLLQVEIEIRFIVEWFGVGKGPVDKWSIEELLTLKFIETFFLLKRLWL